MKHSLRAAALLCVALIISSNHALAEPTAAERETARGAMDEADRLRAAGDLSGALSRYRAAHDIMRVPTTGIEVARTQELLGQLVEARGTAIETAHLPTLAGEPAVFSSARRAASELASSLEPRIPELTTTIEPAGLDYALIIDAIALPAQARSIPFRTNPGEHSVTVQAAGYVTSEQKVTLGESEQRTLPIALKRSKPSAVLQVASAAPAVSETPGAATASQSDDDDDGRQGQRVRGLIALGVGGAVLAAGIVTGTMSALQTSELKDQCRAGMCPPSTDDKRDSANTLANIANVGIPLGLLGIAYGVYELLDAHTPAKPTAATSSDPKLQVVLGTRSIYAGWRGSL